MLILAVKSSSIWRRKKNTNKINKYLVRINWPFYIQ